VGGLFFCFCVCSFVGFFFVFFLFFFFCFFFFFFTVRPLKFVYRQERTGLRRNRAKASWKVPRIVSGDLRAYPQRRDRVDPTPVHVCWPLLPPQAGRPTPKRGRAFGFDLHPPEQVADNQKSAPRYR